MTAWTRAIILVAVLLTSNAGSASALTLSEAIVLGLKMDLVGDPYDRPRLLAVRALERLRDDELKNIGRAPAREEAMPGDIVAELEGRLLGSLSEGQSIRSNLGVGPTFERNLLPDPTYTALKVVEAYFAVLEHRELVNVSERDQFARESIAESVRAQLAGGRGSRADVAQVEGLLVAGNAKLQRDLRALAAAGRNLDRLVGQAPDELILPEAPVNALPPDLASLIQGFERSAGLAGSAASALVGTAKETAEDPVRLAERRLTWSREAAVSTLVGVWHRWDGLKYDIESQEGLVQWRTEQRDAYAQEFEVSQRTTLDVLDAEIALSMVQRELVVLQAAELVTIYRLLAYSGQLLPVLGIDPLRL